MTQVKHFDVHTVFKFSISSRKGLLAPTCPTRGVKTAASEWLDD
jgi:hypothetical protein